MSTPQPLTSSENCIHSSKDALTSVMGTSLNEMPPAEAENNAPVENSVRSNPEMPEEIDLSTQAELFVSAEKALVVSMSSIIATVTSDTGKEDAKEPPQEEESANTLLTKSTKSITLKHHNGVEFMLPLALCQTQKGMEDLIKLTYGDDEEAKKEIDQGKYELTANGVNILPHFWDILVEPGWEVTIRLKSQSKTTLFYDSDESEDSPESKENTETLETSYTEKLKYTVTIKSELRQGVTSCIVQDQGHKGHGYYCLCIY